MLFVRDGETGAYTPADHHLVVQQALRALEADTAVREVFPTPDSVRNMLRLRMGHLERETFTVLFLDSHNRLIAIEDLFTGTLNATSVYPREVVKAALQHNAAAVILAHNHPSGIATPSRADEALTQTLKAALQLVDVRCLDHLIVCKDTSLSFAEKGLI